MASITDNKSEQPVGISSQSGGARHEEIRARPQDYHSGTPNRQHTAEAPTPLFEVHQPECRAIFGQNPSIQLALEDKSVPLFHEAAVFVPASNPDESDTLFVTSNQLADGIRILKLSRNDKAWKYETLPDGTVPMANGAVNYPRTDSVLFCVQGTRTEPGGLCTVPVLPPHKATPLLTSYHGRWFNSTNDVILARDGAVWFTDPMYGHEQGFRPSPQLPSQVYRFDPERGDLRAIADGFGRPNGLCFSPDERTLYVTDTDWVHGDGTMVDTRVSHIYAFTVEQFHGAPFATNRRLFAMADVGIPDGIKCDLEGNVYSGCGDGVNIWAPNGMLLGKIVVPGGVANFCFGRPGEVLLLNETRFWVAQVATHVQGALLEGMGVRMGVRV